MRYSPIPSEFYHSNRDKFSQKLKPNSVAVFLSNDIMPTNADGTMGFKQNSDLFYLTGIDQEDTTLILFPDYKNNEQREVLFIKETSEHIAIWEGVKLSKSEAYKLSGIKTVYWSHQFESVLKNLIYEAENIYLNNNEHLRAEIELKTKNDRFIDWCQEKYPLHQYHRAAPILSELRMIKSPLEIAQIEKACQITEKAFQSVLQFTKPEVWEFEIEAEIIHEFIKNRSRVPAYASIIASGKNACVLHYNSNNEKCKKGDLILMDFGAEYGNYAADLTRCIPVSGKFSNRQKKVYNSVKTILLEAQKLLIAGNSFKEYQSKVIELVEKELVLLKLLSLNQIKKQDPKNPAYRKYFMHGISHFLGLDVHDVGNKDAKMKEGMVLTCEPGIYIPEEKLGIRLENNILIQKKGNKNLMASIPLETEEIEYLMAQK